MSRLFSRSVFRPLLSCALLLGTSLSTIPLSWAELTPSSESAQETGKPVDNNTAKPPVNYYFSGMAPLLLPDTSSARQEFGTMLAEAKRNGLNAVSVDVWWGKVAEKSKNPDDWNWQYYDDLFHLIKAFGVAGR